ncbi:MFS transporter [Alicyclobacillus fodiniaquatilis]|uniref:MFS transporter n=1 Tax=Alicyclobacillus fodiniaquatilis TaxID=1661150 RepID=A0ABW4JD72_9BACL
MHFNTTILKNKNFLSYWSGGLISGLGDAMFLLALNWMVVEKTNSGFILGTIMASISLPQILLVTIGGVIADRLNPKWVMIASDAVRGLIMVFLVVMSFDGVPPMWTLFMMAIIYGCMDAVFFPAQSAFQQRLVSSEQYTQSFGLLMISVQVAGIAGPVLGGALISKWGYQLVIVANGLSFVCSILLLLLVKPLPAASADEAEKERLSFLSDIHVGIRYVLKNHLILTTSLSAFLVNACVQATFIAIPFLAKQAHLGAQGFGLMNMGIGIGGAFAAIFFAFIRIQKPTPRMTFLACFFEGLAFLGLVFTRALWPLIGTMLVIGITEAVVNTIAPSVNQKIIPPHLIGRVISFMIVLMSGSEPLARAFSGWMIQWSGVTVLLICTGVLEMVVAVIGYFMPVIRNYASEQAQIMAQDGTMKE